MLIVVVIVIEVCVYVHSYMHVCTRVRVCTDLGRRSKQLRCLKMTVHISFKFSKQNSHDLIKCSEISQS